MDILCVLPFKQLTEVHFFGDKLYYTVVDESVSVEEALFTTQTSLACCSQRAYDSPYTSVLFMCVICVCYLSLFSLGKVIKANYLINKASN